MLKWKQRKNKILIKKGTSERSKKSERVRSPRKNLYTNFFKFHFRSEGGVMLIKENQIIKATELAKLLGITDRHLRNLANEGVIKKTEKGKYLLLESVRGYIEYIESKNDVDFNLKDEKIKEEIKKIKKETELKGLKIKELKNQLHSASIIEKVMTSSLVNLKGRLLSLSNRLAPQLIALDNLGEIQEVIQDSIVEALEELSEYSPELFKNKNFIEEDEEEEQEGVEIGKGKRGRSKKGK